jgi:hypothetical protein
LKPEQSENDDDEDEKEWFKVCAKRFQISGASSGSSFAWDEHPDISLQGA